MNRHGRFGRQGLPHLRKDFDNAGDNRAPVGVLDGVETLGDPIGALQIPLDVAGQREVAEIRQRSVEFGRARTK